MVGVAAVPRCINAFRVPHTAPLGSLAAREVRPLTAVLPPGPPRWCVRRSLEPLRGGGVPSL